MYFSSYMAAALLLASCGAVRADFSYHTSSRLSGGAMMQFAGAMGDKLKQAADNTVSVKGNKMAYISAKTGSIIDLDAQTVTTFDSDAQTYWVLTFEQMKKMMDDAAASAGSNAQGPALGDPKISMKEGPGTRVALGLPTHEEIVTLDMTMTDPKSGQNSTMEVVSDMFLAKGIEGADEMRAFHQKMGGKVAWAPGGMPMMNQPAMAKAMTEMYASRAKLDGMPLVTVVSVSGAMPGMPNMGALGGAAPGALPPGLAGAMAARMGRKKSADDAAAGAGSNSGALIEITMEVTSTSAAPVDPNVFNIPSGYQKTDGPPARRGRMPH